MSDFDELLDQIASEATPPSYWWTCECGIRNSMFADACYRGCGKDRPDGEKRDDEQNCKDFYYQSFLDRGTSAGRSWRELTEPERMAWRCECREGEARLFDA